MLATTVQRIGNQRTEKQIAASQNSFFANTN